MTTDLETRLARYRPVLDEAIERHRPEARRPARRPWRSALAAAAAVAVLAGGVALVAPDGGGTVATTETDLATPPDGARLLLDLPGWWVSRADERLDVFGEMTFTDGSSQAELRWQAGDQDDLATLVDDRSASADLVTETVVAGNEATVTRYAGTSDYTAMWLAPGYVFEMRAGAPSVEAFRQLAGGLQAVAEEAWLAAMPPAAIRPDSRPAEVDRLLADVPIPPGFSADPFRTGDEVSDRYQLGAQVLGAVACGWIDEWLRAVDAGDVAAASAAADVLAMSRGWTGLEEMDPLGDYPEVVMGLAGKVQEGEAVAVRAAYESSLGCPR